MIFLVRQLQHKLLCFLSLSPNHSSHSNPTISFPNLSSSTSFNDHSPLKSNPILWLQIRLSLCHSFLTCISGFKSCAFSSSFSFMGPILLLPFIIHSFLSYSALQRQIDFQWPDFGRTPSPLCNCNHGIC